MVELPVVLRSVVNALFEAPRAWRSLAQVAEALGIGVDEATDRLCDLNVGGWVEVWEGDGRGGETGPLVTLSPLGAERLGVRLVESSEGRCVRWARVGDPEPPAPRATNVCASARGASLEFVPDHSPPPDRRAADAERAGAYAATPADPSAAKPAPRGPAPDAPPPSYLVGLALTPWPGPAAAADAESVCPACGSRRLLPHMYCLYCDRWGLDELSPPAVDAPVVAPPRPPADPNPVRDRALSDTLRARRKSKRQERQKAQAEAERARGRTKPNDDGRKPGSGAGTHG